MSGFRSVFLALVAGGLFGAGLIVSGMTRPDKIVYFLDFFGDWDASLAFVMAGAVSVYAPLSRLVLKRRAPVCASCFTLPESRDIDAKLVVGSATFGLGWGLAGFCPGPVITSLGGGTSQAFLFVVAMLFGFGLKRGLDIWQDRGEPHISERHA